MQAWPSSVLDSLGAELGATRANDFPRQADECGQAAGDHARSWTDLDGAERGTGNYGSVSVVPGGSGWTAARIGVGDSGWLATDPAAVACLAADLSPDRRPPAWPTALTWSEACPPAGVTRHRCATRWLRPGRCRRRPQALEGDM